MKAIFKQTAPLAIVILFLFTACKKDEVSNPGPGNGYTYQDGGNPKTIKITDAYYVVEDNVGINPDEIELYFSGEQVNEGIYINLTGAGISTMLPEGNFTKSGAIAFYGGRINTSGNNISYLQQSIDRKVSVAKDGGNYKINFEFTTGVGLVKGSYTGPVADVSD